MVTLKDLIDQTDFNDVWKCLLRHHDAKKKIKKYKNFYEKLMKITPNKNETNMYIYITVFKDEEDGDDSYCIDTFDENDNLLYYEVSGGDDECDVYGLEACSFESWLGFYISQETLDRFTSPNIIAHCIWEMTFFGFEQKRNEKGCLMVD